MRRAQWAAWKNGCVRLLRIGVDAGGTFTDFVAIGPGGTVSAFKLRSNPSDPASVILAGIERAAAGADAEVVHGSTVATNALLERKGARTALVTTAGFEDVLEIGRQNREELYNLLPEPRCLPVERELAFGVAERTLYDGAVESAAAPAELAGLRRRLQEAGVEAVAVSFLHSYANPANERAAVRALRGLGYVCASHEISPEFREYERTATTVVNAYVGPLMERYLRRLGRASQWKISIFQSNGGSMTAREARRQPVRTVLSGPAGGVVGAIYIGRRAGYPLVMGFDMGGTSTDVSLAEGEPRETTESRVGGLPIRVPMLDIHTVGAGGGSIARVDEGGRLLVGPESAGADPGPACYGRGTDATVTDAHVVLGRIRSGQFLGGEMAIEEERSAAAVDRIAAALGIDRVQAAAGILRVANAGMERAIRAISVERGYDPRRFALVAFGGCGGLHACELAEELDIRTVLVPEHAGVLSALGMLLADRIRDYAAGVLGRSDYERRFRRLERLARRETPGAELARSADIRYAGQSYELTVPWEARDPAAPFHAAHARTYGYARPEHPIEIVTLRVRARLRRPKPRWRARRVAAGQQGEVRRVFTGGRWRRTPALPRAAISGEARPGPMLVLDYGATTLVPPGWRVRRDATGSLIIERTRR